MESQINEGIEAPRTLQRLVASSLALLCILLALATPASAQNQRVIDEILVLVDGDIITRTDLIWNLALDKNAPSPAGPVSADLLARELDTTINQRLLAHEAARLPSAEITKDEVDKKRVELSQQFSSEAAFRTRIESVGLTPDKLDEMIRQLIAIERFVEFRFRSFVFVSEQDIQRFYDQEFAPKMRDGGAVPQPLDAVLPNKRTVREDIAEIVKAEKITQEIDRWLTDASQRAEIVKLAEPRGSNAG